MLVATIQAYIICMCVCRYKQIKKKKYIYIYIYLLGGGNKSNMGGPEKMRCWRGPRRGPKK